MWVYVDRWPIHPIPPWRPPWMPTFPTLIHKCAPLLLPPLHNRQQKNLLRANSISQFEHFSLPLRQLRNSIRFMRWIGSSARCSRMSRPWCYKLPVTINKSSSHRLRFHKEKPNSKSISKCRPHVANNRNQHMSALAAMWWATTTALETSSSEVTKITYYHGWNESTYFSNWMVWAPKDR